MKTLYFTTELTPDLTNLENVTLGIIGNQEYPKDDIKRVPALKLIKAMKQMTNKEDYIVMGDPEFVEAGKKLGFQTEEAKEPEEEKEDIKPEGELTQIASSLIALDKKYRELEIKYGNAEERELEFQKKEADLKKKYDTDLDAEREIMKSEVKKIKQMIKKIIKE